MHAVVAILAALVRRARDRCGRPPRRVGGRRRARVDVARGRRVPRDRRRAGPRPRSPHRSVRVLRQLRSGRRRLAVGRGDRAALLAQPLPARSAASSGSTHQIDDAVQDDIRADLRAAFKTKTRDEWAAQLTPADTCVAPVLSVPDLVDDPQFVARGAFVEAEHPTAGTFRQVGPVLAGQVAPDGPYVLRDATETDTEALLTRPGFTARRGRRAAPREWSRDRMSRSPEPTSSSCIDMPQYPEVAVSSRSSRATSGRRARPSRTATRCSGTTTSRPRSPAGPIAPPTMVSVWFRPHHWRPGRTEPQVPLQSTST